MKNTNFFSLGENDGLLQCAALGLRATFDPLSATVGSIPQSKCVLGHLAIFSREAKP